MSEKNLFWRMWDRLTGIAKLFGVANAVSTALGWWSLVGIALVALGSYIGTGIDALEKQGWGAKYAFGILLALAFATLILVVATAIPATLRLFGVEWPRANGGAAAQSLPPTGPTQTVHLKGIGVPSNALTREQEHFRHELRKFVTRLAPAHRKLCDVSVGVADIGRSRQSITFLATFGIESLRPKIEELERLAEVDIAAMDQNRLQTLAAEFVRGTYGGTQTLISRLGEALRQAGVSATEENARLSRKLMEWLEANSECLRTLRDLNTSPEAAILKKLPEKFFGTVDRNRWGAGLR